MKRHNAVIFLVLFAVLSVWPERALAQRILDTLPPAYKIDVRNRDGSAAESYYLQPLKTRRVASPMGEGDAIKYIQTLPGVSMGGDGGSALYVRGGNMGSNLMTLDGVPVYGFSHLLGMAAIIPQDILSESSFFVGGFPSDAGNLTASHIRLLTKDGDMSRRFIQLSATPFLLSGLVDTPLIQDTVSVIGSIRISPLGWEYKAFQPMINQYQNVFDNFGAMVGDLFGKLTWRQSARSNLSFSCFGSLDRYRFVLKDQSSDVMGWNNLLLNTEYHINHFAELDDIHASLSFNRHIGVQEQEFITGETYHRFQMRNNLAEVTLSLSGSKRALEHSDFLFGLKARGAVFNPGTSRMSEGIRRRGAETTPLVDSRTGTILFTMHGQWEYTIPSRFLLRLALRGNAYAYGVGTPENGWLFHPEASVTSRWYMQRQIGMELSFDALTQYYHTLEGIPLGWSLDMTVPSDSALLPEQSLQGYFGFFGGFQRHRFRAGAFYKQMRHIVYYGKASAYFDSSQSGWRENINVGEGTSRGAEFLYEKDGDVLSWRASYTLSKTDRLFPGLNGGKRFPSKFDRRHIANVSGDWRFIDWNKNSAGVSLQFTYQSGHWESLQEGTVSTFFIGKKDAVPIPFVSAVNNFEMPAYIRLDASFFMNWIVRNQEHEFRIGVYNVLNRHNPFMLHYNVKTGGWNYVSLFPVLPTVSYRIGF
ncbi:MAG: TonB-dependent receptor plug domain-containing protein [Bacteroidales bacterium]|nr:TonB-dependent receptor plug domain-containing protein [Bacteroidales bacterium]